MSSSPLVSVIAACYNQANYLEECLDAIAAQTLKAHELIITDDASTDDSQERIHRWMSRQPKKSRFIAHEKNRGVCRTLNEALRVARGKYIAITAVDDVWLPNKLQSQVEEMERLGSKWGMLYSDAFLIDPGGKRLQQTFMERFPDLQTPPNGEILERLLHGNFIPAPTVLVRKKSYDKVGMFDEELLYEDFDMWLRIAHVSQVAYHKDIQTMYRIHPENFTSKLNSPLGGELATTFAIIEKILTQWALTPKQKKIAKQKLYSTASEVFAQGDPKKKTYLWRGLKRTGSPLLFMRLLMTMTMTQRMQSKTLSTLRKLK